MFRSALALAPLLASVLSACGPRVADRPAVRDASLHVTAPNFSDGHPVDWNGNPPSTHEVHGIDISVWQSEVDWPRAHANGVNFAFLKATEGADHLDPAFLQNWRAAAAAGVPLPRLSLLLSLPPRRPTGALAHSPRPAQRLHPAPVLEMEWTPRSPTCRNKHPSATIRAEARIFLDAVQHAYGKRPILYTTLDFYQENELWRLTGTDFWLRSVAAHPSNSFPGQHWLFWQYSGTGHVPGIGTATDLNIFAGSASAYAGWLP